ncbi:hypothetical protein BRC90_11750 [Halobacteriales archaeon QS_4_69_34]|nr:MAG: hypothetical protein BRC90_11750 [Halobacteriales archaeon QS_4_69_34]
MESAVIPALPRPGIRSFRWAAVDDRRHSLVYSGRERNDRSRLERDGRATTNTFRSLLFDSPSGTIGTTLLVLLVFLALAGRGGGSLAAAGALTDPAWSASRAASRTSTRARRRRGRRHRPEPAPFGLARDDTTMNYAVDVNGTRMAAGSAGLLSLSPGRTTIPVGPTPDNEALPAWWGSHVRRGQRTDVRIEFAAHRAADRRRPGRARRLPYRHVRDRRLRGRRPGRRGRDPTPTARTGASAATGEGLGAGTRSPGRARGSYVSGTFPGT